MLAAHHDFMPVVEDLNQLCNQAKLRLAVFGLIADRYLYMNGIANKNRLDKTQSFVAVG